MKQTIKDNIKNHGYHIYTVKFAPYPRYIYTIGLSKELGHEFILAGGYFYSINEAVALLKERINAFKLNPNDSLDLYNVHHSWSNELMLGAIEHDSNMKAYQFRPPSLNGFIDVPNMELPLKSSEEPSWKWLIEKWPFQISDKLEAVTNISALKGKALTEACRWDDDEWEIFNGSGPDTPKEDLRIVSLGFLLGHDESLAQIIENNDCPFWFRESGMQPWFKWEKN